MSNAMPFFINQGRPVVTFAAQYNDAKLGWVDSGDESSDLTTITDKAIELAGFYTDVEWRIVRKEVEPYVSIVR